MENSLYRITNEIQVALDEISEASGELTPELEEKIAALESMLLTKTDNVVSWVQSQEDLITLAKTRIGELGELISKVEKRLSSFDSYVDACMRKMNSSKLEGKLCTITKRKPVQVVNIVNETLIPMEFIKVPEPKPSIQRAEIGKALKAGQEVPGATLTESQNISISYKIK